MCYERSWFVSKEQPAKKEERKPDIKDKRSETVEALLRESNEEAQKVKAAPAKEAAPAK
jgi:hypothetical protein